MQQQTLLTEVNTAPRSVAGQFEDADDDSEVEVVSPPPSTSSSQKVVPTRSMPTWMGNNNKDDDSSLAKLSTKTIAPPCPPPSHLQRRISSNTTEATKALLAFAASGAAAPPPARKIKKKKKTFVVRLEEIKEYTERHGRVPRRDPIETDEPWEQNLLAWIQDCRRQFRQENLSAEKAKALSDLGLEGFQDVPPPAVTAADLFLKAEAAHAAQSHPALRALWLKRQQDEARLLQMRQRMAMAATVAPPPPTRRSLDPDGATPTDEEIYPAETFKKPEENTSPAYPNRNEAAQSQRMAAMEELQARESYAREAILREQLMVREQRIAQAMAAQRRLNMGGPFGGMGGLLDGPRDQMFMGQQHRMAALMQAQMMQQQRRASLQAQEMFLRRPSDASTAERRPSDAAVGSSSTAPTVRTTNTSTTNQQQPQRQPAPQPQQGPPRARKTWDQRMKEMWTFFLGHGHTQVQTRGEHRELGRWLSTTRCRLRDGLLPQHLAKEFCAMEQWTLEDDNTDPPAAKVERASSPERRVPSATVTTTPPTTLSKVKTIGSPSRVAGGGKTKRALPKSWHQSFMELQQFKVKFGHCDVKMIVNSPYGLLGKWLASQRSRHKLGQLPVDKVNRLREIGCNGFAEGGKVPHRSQYRADDEEAEFDQAIRKAKGVPGEEEAAVVITTTTTTPRAHSPPCSPATREKRVRHSYETRVEHIKAFKEKHGHCKIRLGSTDKHEELLARWLASARSRYRGGQFKEERAAELRAIGCDGFDCTMDCSASMDEEEEAQVAAAPSRKRDSPTRTATPSPTPSLEAEEGGEPAAKKQRGGGKRQTFDDMMKELVQYQYVYGVGCSVPKPDGDNGKLGRWLAFQRRQFIAGKLSDDRIEKLRIIGRKEFNKSALIVRAAERAACSIHMEEEQ